MCRVSGQLPHTRKLSREKTFTNWWKIWFSWRKLLRIVPFCWANGRHAPKYRRENFTNSHKTVKFAQVFFLEGFQLYGANMHAENTNMQYAYKICMRTKCSHLAQPKVKIVVYGWAHKRISLHHVPLEKTLKLPRSQASLEHSYLFLSRLGFLATSKSFPKAPD